MTPEIRERIFALYWGQKVSKHNTLIGEAETNGYGTFREIEFRHLLLKPLSSISDEDAVEVTRIALNAAQYEEFDTCVHRGSFLVEVRVSNEGNAFTVYIPHDTEELEMNFYGIRGNAGKIIDFLRSKGYALPYLDWTVEELVEAGVYKLQNQ